LDLRILCQTFLHIVRRFVENLTGRNAVAACFARIGHLEHTGHKIGDAVGAVAFSGNPAQLECLYDGKPGQQKHQSCYYTRPNTMPSNIFPHSVTSTGRTRHNRLIV
jgi:hypothetical protein